MRLDVPYKLLDLEPDQDFLNFDFSTITEKHWKEERLLSIMVPDIFGELLVFPLLRFTPKHWNNPRNPDAKSTPCNNSHPVWELAMNQIRKLEDLYDANARIAVLDGLPPGAKINPHADVHNLYSLAHRVHVPLVTSPGVKFFIDEEMHYFEQGKMYEFDNKRVHSVHNDTDIFRIHMVVDLIPK